MFRNLGQTIAIIRGVRGLNQAALAKRAGIGKGQLSKYENGKELPMLPSLEKVLKALGIGATQFFQVMALINKLPDEALGAIPEPGESLLQPLTEKAFATVLGDLMTLYGQVFASAVADRLKAQQFLKTAGTPEAEAPDYEEVHLS